MRMGERVLDDNDNNDDDDDDNADTQWPWSLAGSRRTGDGGILTEIFFTQASLLSPKPMSKGN